MFNNIPSELRELRQWVLWRIEWKTDSEGKPDLLRKPTKVPYQPWPGGKKASATDPNQWGSFTDATSAPLTQTEPCDPNDHPSVTGFAGIGFVFVKGGKYTGVDLDDTHGDEEAFSVQRRIYEGFASYSEKSPSGQGLHIICRGEVPHGKRRSSVEVYSSDRFFTMTGNTINNMPIVDCQPQLDILFEQMGGGKTEPTFVEDKPQTETDEEVIANARAALNGEKFSALFDGDFTKYYGAAHGHQGEGRSEADFALVDILAYHTNNQAQLRRLYAMSDLGKAPKDNYAHRYLRTKYVDYMVARAYDRRLPDLNPELLIAVHRQYLAAEAAKKAHTAPATAQAQQEPGGTVAGASCTATSFPPGLLGDIAQFIFDASARPVADIALAGAIGFLSGIAGRAYNTYTGAGLNQYIMLLAPTGTGKDAISSGTSKLFDALATQNPFANEFKGPGELVSSAGLLKWLDKKPCVFTIVGEIGLMMQQMASPNGPSHLKGLQRVLTQVYSKSGQGNTLDASAYSDQTKNTSHIHSPSLTILGESVPGEFYASLDENIIANGLLPRFLTFEYTGNRPYYIEGKEFAKPPIALVQSLSDLIAMSLSLAHNRNVHVVQADAASMAKFREFDHWTTDQINKDKDNAVLPHLWNRAHLKAIKLASIYAVGTNYLNPVIDMQATMWATEIVAAQVNALLDRFKNDEVGDNNSSEAKQMREVCKAIATYVGSPVEKFATYGLGKAFHKPMWQDGIIPHSMLHRRLVATAAFKNDKRGATDALNRTIKHLLENDDLREMPKQQLTAKYGTAAKCYVIANSTRFGAV